MDGSSFPLHLSLFNKPILIHERRPLAGVFLDPEIDSLHVAMHPQDIPGVHLVCLPDLVDGVLVASSFLVDLNSQCCTLIACSRSLIVMFPDLKSWIMGRIYSLNASSKMPPARRWVGVVAQPTMWPARE